MARLGAARIGVVRPGLLTTVQDLGRVGYQRFGLPLSGAMDRPALRLANRLVGNADQAAGLEITLSGPALLFEREAVIALTGADLSASLDGTPITLWEATRVAKGSTLTFGQRRAGARAYLAVAGGLNVPLVLGSRSTHLRSRTGGLMGRALVQGDVLRGGRPASKAFSVAGRSVPPEARPLYQREPMVRVIPGPQADFFLPEALEALTGGSYTVTPQSDRMGFRLQGPPLIHAGPAEIVSDATPFGAIQVPANRQPILLMADHQTTGGYPKVGVVISVDVPLAAQLIPGESLRFALVDVGEARAVWRAQEARFARLMPSWGT